MVIDLGNLPYALALTFNPNKGEGWTESIIAVLIILTFSIVLISDGDVPQSVTALVGLVLGFYFGNQNTKYKKNA